MSLGPVIIPHGEHLLAIDQAMADIKHELIRLRSRYENTQPDFFAPVAHLSNSDLVDFNADDVIYVRIYETPSGDHIFGKLRIPIMPDCGPAYIHIHVFAPEQGPRALLYGIYLQNRDGDSEGLSRQAIFTIDKELKWFDW